MRTAAVLTKAGTPTVTADVKSFARTGNTGMGHSALTQSVHAKHLPTAPAAITVLTIPADQDAILTHNAVMEKVAYLENAKPLVISLLHVQTQNIRHVRPGEQDIFANARLHLVLLDTDVKLIPLGAVLPQTLLILVFVYLKYVQRTVIVIMEKHVYQDLANE